MDWFTYIYMILMPLLQIGIKNPQTLVKEIHTLESIDQMLQLAIAAARAQQQLHPTT